MNAADIQAAYYMVAATGVLIAAIFDIINLRSTRRAREWELARLHTAGILTPTRLADFATLMNMEWKDEKTSVLEVLSQNYGGASFIWMDNFCISEVTQEERTIYLIYYSLEGENKGYTSKKETDTAEIHESL